MSKPDLPGSSAACSDMLTVRVVSAKAEKTRKYIGRGGGSLVLAVMVVMALYTGFWDSLFLLPIVLFPFPLLLIIKTDETVIISKSCITNSAPSRKIEKTIRWEHVRYARITQVFTGEAHGRVPISADIYLLYSDHFISKLDAHPFDDATARQIFKNPTCFISPFCRKPPRSSKKTGSSCFRASDTLRCTRTPSRSPHAGEKSPDMLSISGTFYGRYVNRIRKPARGFSAQ